MVNANEYFLYEITVADCSFVAIVSAIHYIIAHFVVRYALVVFTEKRMWWTSYS